MKILRLAGIFGLLTFGIAGYAIVRLNQPYRGFSEPVFVEVPYGTATASIGSMLAGAGVIGSRWDFWLARLMEHGRKPQAGEYRFEKAATPLEIFERLARGDIFYYQLVIPEGKNMFDIGALAEGLGIFPAAEFVKAAHNPALIRDLDPHAPTLEGYLFPSTYRLKRHSTPEQLCRMMTARFRDVWRSLPSSATPHDTVTMASLVEKEGKLAAERPLIAAVFENRLKIGMKLDCDPTTIYAALLDGRYKGVIHRSDLDSDNAYNTYRHKGLPPGPIANPGLPSLQAVLQPADSEALYFVLRPDGSGGHEFTSTIAAHQAATARYRRGLQR